MVSKKLKEENYEHEFNYHCERCGVKIHHEKLYYHDEKTICHKCYEKVHKEKMKLRGKKEYVE